MMSPNHAGIRDSELRRKDAARATWRGNVEKTGEKTARKKTQQCGGYEKQRDENRYRGETEKRIGQTDSRNAKVLYVKTKALWFSQGAGLLVSLGGSGVTRVAYWWAMDPTV